MKYQVIKTALGDDLHFMVRCPWCGALSAVQVSTDEIDLHHTQECAGCSADYWWCGEYEDALRIHTPRGTSVYRKGSTLDCRKREEG